MASYILRAIDDELWRQVKSKAALEGVTLKALIERLLREWLRDVEHAAHDKQRDIDHYMG